VLCVIGVAALALPAWVSVAAIVIVIAATVADGMSVRRPPRLERVLGEVLSRGVPAGLAVTAAASDQRRVLLRQPATPALEVRAVNGPRDLRGDVVPTARGRHALPGVASASVGPLGLARWHHAVGPPTEVMVYPDLRGARRLVLALRQGRAAQDGRLRRGPLGLGADFESVREYSPDDDIRQVNWRASARLGRPMSNQYRVEQDRDVVCLVDMGRLMAAPVAAGTLLDAALDACTAVALAADELGDRCGAIAFDDAIRRAVAPARLGGRRVVHALFDQQPALRDSDFERAFLRVGRSRRALVIVFTDLVDEAAARSLVLATPMLARRHAVTVASVSDPDLEEAVTTAPRRLEDVYGMVAALSVLDARARAVAHLRRAGAEVVQAPAHQLPERCVQAYLRAKARARL
jgi:uncharacterized protein (DUF58 family)